MRKSSVREALPKPNILQLSEYDVTQKIMDSLVNPCHRAVLFSVVNESKIANQISTDLNISLSAVYKTLGKLEELTLVFVEKFEFREGKKIKFYKSRIGNAEIALHGRLSEKERECAWKWVSYFTSLVQGLASR